MKSASLKKQVIRLVEALPEKVTLDEVMEELYFKLQVDKGLKELDAGKGIPHKKVEARISKWLT